MASTHSEIDLAPYIDHALLSPIATPEQIEQWCEDADRLFLRRSASIQFTFGRRQIISTAGILESAL